MRRKPFNPVGALHPILFFAGVYTVALVFSIFICSTIFYSCNASGKFAGPEKKTQQTTETRSIASLR